ncbi:MAG: class I SAM-dependent methyltransferase [Bacteroidota bacterium]
MAAPYSRLAPGYDAVMAHVDYHGWALHVRDLLDRHAPETRTAVEIGCGTGSLALELDRVADLQIRGLDASPAMVAEAQRKAALAGADVPFAVGRFDAPIPGPLADAVLLVYDGLNYLLGKDDVRALFRHVAAALVPGGVFLFDQSTPANSLNNRDAFDDEGETDAFAYVRSGHYDEATRLHTTTFRLTADGRTEEEAHVQRAYTYAEIGGLLAASPLAPEAAYDGFSTDPATAESERIHWVARVPEAGA